MSFINKQVKSTAGYFLSSICNWWYQGELGFCCKEAEPCINVYGHVWLHKWIGILFKSVFMKWYIISGYVRITQRWLSAVDAVVTVRSGCSWFGFIILCVMMYVGGWGTLRNCKKVTYAGNVGQVVDTVGAVGWWCVVVGMFSLVQKSQTSGCSGCSWCSGHSGHSGCHHHHIAI